jgi:hypothetical protein
MVGRFATGFLLAILALPGARAATEAGTAQFEVWFGAFEPGADFLDTNLSGGVRFGGNRYDWLTVLGEIGIVRADGSTGGNDLRWEATTLDLAFEFNFATKKNVVPAFVTGVGYAFPTSNDSIPPELRDGLLTDSLTIQAGGALKIDLGRDMFLRPAARMRWYFERSENAFDTELLLGLGWRFRRADGARAHRP